MRESQGSLRKVEGFKSSEKRLVQIFKKSRDCWKKNAAIKQKKLRDLEVKVRDLSISRDSWKSQAKQSEEDLQRLKKELDTIKKKKRQEMTAQEAPL